MTEDLWKVDELRAKIAEFKEKGISTYELEMILVEVEVEMGTESYENVILSHDLVAHYESVGVRYKGDSKQMQEQLERLWSGTDRKEAPGINLYHPKKEIGPFIDSLNPGDTVFALFNTFREDVLLHDERKHSKYRDVPLNYSLIGALQNRVRIITKEGGHEFTIFYSEIIGVSRQWRQLRAAVSSARWHNPHLIIKEKNGTITRIFLDVITHGVKAAFLRADRFCTLVNYALTVLGKVDELRAKIAECKEKGISTDGLERVLAECEAEMDFQKADRLVRQTVTEANELVAQYQAAVERVTELKAKIAEFKEKGINTDELERVLVECEAEMGLPSSHHV